MNIFPHHIGVPGRQGPHSLALGGALIGLALFAGCVIVVPTDSPVTVPTKVDLVVLADTERSTAALAVEFEVIINSLIDALGELDITVARTAVAPLYRRVGNSVPLIFGSDDPEAEFATISAALVHIAQNGSETLGDASGDDGANLASFGDAISRTGIYYPIEKVTGTRPFYEGGVDGFIVLNLSATARHCSHRDCRIKGVPAATYFSAQENGQATWLKLGGDSGLPVSRIMHLSLTTEEGVSYAEFYSRCSKQPGFSSAFLDFMEPSSVRFHEPMAEALRAAGGHARHDDLCAALSYRAPQIIGAAAADIAAMF